MEVDEMSKRETIDIMSPETYNKLYTIDRAIRKAIHICVPICFILLILVAFNGPWKQLFIYALCILAVICGILILCRIILSPFVKSDEQEEFEQKIDYILEQKSKQKAQHTASIEDYTPLCNLTEEQKVQIEQVLHDLPANDKRPESINLALVAQYLTALEKLGKANLTDRYHLRLWIAQVTGKQVPLSSQFNEAVPSKATSKVLKAQKDIERILS